MFCAPSRGVSVPGGAWGACRRPHTVQGSFWDDVGNLQFLDLFESLKAVVLLIERLNANLNLKCSTLL
ncbi:hypothetical protein L596_012482 [Steinernema carpocapsae]|uniref:Uncharacterized protein n=1 Tax=Steinernema carpocapsae TaxID=34508 RepID=A0A4U5NY05_STECR|nr:hypothetical protein L596_012482 [Steinernema carpocapsae]